MTRADRWAIGFAWMVVTFWLGWRCHEWFGPAPQMIHHEEITQIGIDTTLILYEWTPTDCQVRRVR